MAGFVDGEGSIALYKRKDIRTKKGFTINAKVSMGNTNKEFMEEMVNLCKGKLFAKKNGKNCKILYEVHIQNMKGIKAFLENIKEYLIIKRKQAELMVEYAESRLDHASNQYTEREIKLAEMITELNKKGIS